MKKTEFESGPVPPGYAKVISVGPEGEMSNVEVMPTRVAFSIWGIDRPDGLSNKARTIFLVHCWGITTITLDEHGATSKEIQLQ